MLPDHLPAVDDALSAIRYIGQQNAALELTKSYRGLVLQQDVSILEVTAEDATFRTTNIEMSAALKGDVYLHSQLFPKPVMAQLKSLDLKKGILVLSGFAYTDIGLKKRQHERVRPKHPTYVTLHWIRKAVRECMQNISVNGMGILAFKIFEKGMKIQPGSKIQLEFQLSPDYKYTGLTGTIIYLNTIDRYLTTIGIKLFPTARESRLLEKYIAPRKQEILEELNQAYRELIKPRGVESLYF
jgi:PilZ domain